MKRFLTAALLPCAAFAGNLSLSAIAGYGLPIPSQYIGTNSTYDGTKTPTTTDYEGVYGSMADGLRFGGEIGYSVNEMIVLGLGARYEKSSELEQTSTSLYTNYRTVGTRKTTLTAISFLPSVVYILPGEVWQPYARVNGYIGIPTQVVKYDYTTTETGGVDYNYEIEYTGGTAWGFGGGLGFEYKISPTMSLLAEIMSDNWTWAPTEGEYKSYVRDGEDVLSDRTTNQNKTKYVDSYTSEGVTDTASATKQIRTPRTATTVAVNLGLKFRF